MSLAGWIGFTLAYTAMAMAPGPVILLVMSYALGYGRRTAFAVVAGTTLGDATCLCVATLGLGALLAASALAFAVLRIAGAAYLVFLGLRLWRAAPPARTEAGAAPSGSLPRFFAHAYLTATLNPKAILFFMVFVPQFLNPAAPLAGQLAAMVPSVLLCGAIVDGGYSMFAASLRRALGSGRRQRVANRIAGGVLMSEGVLAALGRSLA